MGVVAVDAVGMTSNVTWSRSITIDDTAPTFMPYELVDIVTPAPSIVNITTTRLIAHVYCRKDRLPRKTLARHFLKVRSKIIMRQRHTTSAGEKILRTRRFAFFLVT